MPDAPVPPVKPPVTSSAEDSVKLAMHDDKTPLSYQATLSSPVAIRTQWGFERGDLISLVELTYYLYEKLERLPTKKELASNLFRINPPAPEDFNKIYKSAIFKTACYYRGIRTDDGKPANSALAGLDERQRLTIAAITDYTSRLTLDGKLKRIGVSAWEYSAWMNYPPFRNKIKELADKSLKHSESLADVALASGAVNGKLDFIKYADLRSGRFDPSARSALDVEYVIRSVMEIIMKHVRDPELLRAIGGDLSILAAGAGMNPESAASPELE
jgi:hypothetical protein